MKGLYVSEIIENQGREITSKLYVMSCTVKRKGGKDFCILELSDKSGSVSAVIWQEYFKEEYAQLKGKYVDITGTVEEYLGEKSIKIKRISILEANEIDRSLYVKSPFDLNRLSLDLQNHINMIEDYFLYKLVVTIFSDESMENKYMYCSGSKSLHHRYDGGLCYHSLSLAGGVLSYADSLETLPGSYKLNRDLLRVGSLLHDVGKTLEYELLPASEFTKQGLLRGHINLGVSILDNAYSTLVDENFNEINQELYDNLIHIIMTAHDEAEIKAVTLEASIIANYNRMDNELHGFMDVLDLDAQHSFDEKAEPMTNYNNYYKRKLMKRGAI